MRAHTHTYTHIQYTHSTIDVIVAASALSHPFFVPFFGAIRSERIGNASPR